MNKSCPLKLFQCGDHCKYFRVIEKRPEALRIVGCEFKGETKQEVGDGGNM